MHQKNQDIESTEKNTTGNGDESNHPIDSDERRSALRRIGKYSAYAVPALLALSHKAAAAS